MKAILFAVLVAAVFATVTIGQHAPARVFPLSYFVQNDVRDPGSDMRFIGIQREPVDAPSGTAQSDAIALAATIAGNITAGEVTADKIAIWLRDWGHDYLSSEDNGPQGRRQQTRFFTEADRLNGYVRAHDLSMFPDPGSDDNSDRWYRHPFLQNATLSGPLRQYTQSFTATFVTAAATHGFNPNNVRFHFDCEPYMVVLGNRNSVKVLHELASNPNICNTWKVPGSTGWQPPTAWPVWNATMPSSAPGKTLAEMYAEYGQAQTPPWAEQHYGCRWYRSSAACRRSGQQEVPRLVLQYHGPGRRFCYGRIRVFGTQNRLCGRQVRQLRHGSVRWAGR